MKTDTCCSANGAITDLAILVTPTACELLEVLPLETTFSGSQVEPSTCKCSDGWSSGGRECDRGHTGSKYTSFKTFPVFFTLTLTNPESIIIHRITAGSCKFVGGLVTLRV